MARLESVRTAALDIAYEHAGPPNAYPVVLVHGFPYDPRAFDEVIRQCRRLPHDRALPARLRRHAICLGRYDAIRGAGRDRA